MNETIESNTSSSTEYVEVQIKVPKYIYEFVEALANFSRTKIEQFWETELIDTVKSTIDCISGNYVDKDILIERYNLKQILEDC